MDIIEVISLGKQKYDASVVVSCFSEIFVVEALHGKALFIYKLTAVEVRALAIALTRSSEECCECVHKMLKEWLLSQRIPEKFRRKGIAMCRYGDGLGMYVFDSDQAEILCYLA
ncbi:MAG: hypothetical protein WC422_00110 [Candidatus Paceibacterota bacterium]|jgi:hypothetical protein